MAGFIVAMKASKLTLPWYVGLSAAITLAMVTTDISVGRTTIIDYTLLYIIPEIPPVNATVYNLSQKYTANTLYWDQYELAKQNYQNTHQNLRWFKGTIENFARITPLEKVKVAGLDVSCVSFDKTDFNLMLQAVEEVQRRNIATMEIVQQRNAIRNVIVSSLQLPTFAASRVNHAHLCYPA